MYQFTSHYGRTYEVNIVKSKYYEGGRISLSLTSDTDGPIAIATVNLPDEPARQNETYIKNYAENEGILNFLLENRIVSLVGHTAELPHGVAELVKVNY